MPVNRSLKVGLVFDDSLDSSDGVAQHVKTLGAWLGKNGYQVRYLVGETKLKSWAGGKVYSLSKNQKVYFNGNKMSIPLPANNRRLKKVLDEESFDVLHVMLPYSPFMAKKLINRCGADTAVVGTFHIYPSGWVSSAGSRLLRLFYGRSLRRFSQIVSVSPAAADFAKRAFGIESSVVPNPVELSRFRAAKKDKPASGQRIIFLGRLVKRKGCAELLRAFDVLSKRLPGASLVIAGDGPQRRSLEKFVIKKQLQGRVTFKGYVDESDKPELLASADVACFPSLYGESFGIVLIEAMAAGAGAVLGGDNPGYRTILSGQPGLLVNPKDTTMFAGRIYGLLAHKKARSPLREWAFKAAEQYDIDIVGKQVIELYDSAIARLNKNSHNDRHAQR